MMGEGSKGKHQMSKVTVGATAALKQNLNH
jgi:hypothetical protein